MILKITASIIMSIAAVSAFAATTPLGSAEDSVKWQVTAMKDSKAGLVVSPIGSIDFKYNVKSEGFSPAEAKFMVSVLNNFPGTDVPETPPSREIVDAATDFKLEAIQGSGFANSIADSTKGFTVELQKDGVPLSVDSAKPTLLKDSGVLSGFLAGLDGFAEKGSEAVASFTAIAKKNTVDFKTLPDGAYMGEATAAFKATWSK